MNINLNRRIKLGQLRKKLRNGFNNISIIDSNRVVRNIESLNDIIISDSWSNNLINKNIWNFVYFWITELNYNLTINGEPF